MQSIVLPSELLALSPPPPPEQTHRQERERLPTFLRGPAATRAERACSYLAAAGKQIEELHRRGASGLSVSRLISEAMDRLLVGLWEEVFGDVGSGLSLVALGGYGRRDLAPHSDLDLLLLRSPRTPEKSVAHLA